MRSIRAKKADEAKDKPVRGGGLGYGAMRGGEQRGGLGRSFEDETVPGRQSSHAGERNQRRPDARTHGRLRRD